MLSRYRRYYQLLLQHAAKYQRVNKLKSSSLINLIYFDVLVNLAH